MASAKQFEMYKKKIGYLKIKFDMCLDHWFGEKIKKSRTKLTNCKKIIIVGGCGMLKILVFLRERYQ